MLQPTLTPRMRHCVNAMPIDCSTRCDGRGFPESERPPSDGASVRPTIMPAGTTMPPFHCVPSATRMRSRRGALVNDSMEARKVARPTSAVPKVQPPPLLEKRTTLQTRCAHVFGGGGTKVLALPACTDWRFAGATAIRQAA
jgi:hypothetical protein